VDCSGSTENRSNRSFQRGLHIPDHTVIFDGSHGIGTTIQAAAALIYQHPQSVIALFIIEDMWAGVLAIVLASLSGISPIQESNAPPADEPSKPKSPDMRSLTREQIRELIRQVADKDMENDRKQRDYTFTMRREEHKLDAKHRVKSSESKTSEIMQLYGEQVTRLIARNDQPLSPNETAREEQKIQKLMDKRKNESESDHQRRDKKEEKEREDGRRFVREVADAYNFRLIGVETPEGRPTYVIDAEPRPGYQPHFKEAHILPKFRFRAWIDRSDSQWRKVDVECIDTVSVGLFLLRLHKGSRAVVEQIRINDEVWLPRHISVKADARVALMKGLNIDEEVTFSSYRKFRGDARIMSAGETQDAR